MRDRGREEEKEKGRAWRREKKRAEERRKGNEWGLSLLS